MKYQEAMDYIAGIQVKGIVPGLDCIRALCERLDNPQKDLKFVHIAGTNGKGSTLAYLSTVLKCAGYRVGRYLSPTIFEYRERIQVNGHPITKEALCRGLESVAAVREALVEEGICEPTVFEVETALAFWYFREQKCDIVVLETGMGGLLDATNLIENTLVAVLTSISRDHMQFLGKTLPEIAAHKAGILKPGCIAVSSEQPEEVMAVIRQAAEQAGCTLRIARKNQLSKVKFGTCGKNGIPNPRLDYQSADGVLWKQLEIGLAGSVQPENALLALEALRALGEKGFPVGESAVRKGLRETVWQGRFYTVSRHPLFVTDGAHNEDAARKLADSIEFYFTNKRIVYIIGVLRDKEYQKVIELTHGYADQIITVTPPDNPRALPALDLAQEIAEIHPQVTAVDSLEEAVEMAELLAGPEDVILAFGSLSYLGRLIRIVEKRETLRKPKKTK